jgi:ribosomal protein S18 acetylase RimI-like enzyme
MKIRLAKEKDVKDLLAYLEKNEKVTHLNFFKKRIEYYISNGFILLAKEKEELIGHLFFQVKENINLGVGEIETVNIREDYRGKGIGTKLIKDSVKLMKKHFENSGVKPRCIYTMTRSNNKAAIRIYEKVGLKKQAKIGKIYRDDQPEELIMTLFFKGLN